MEQSVLILILSLFFSAGAALAQTEAGRYTNPQFNISFQPPAGWEPDLLVQYVGPRRGDGSWPTLNLSFNNSLMALNDQNADAVARDLTETLGSRGAERIAVADRRSLKVSGVDGLQIEIAYTQNGLPMRMRQTYLPVTGQNRTYLFTLVDTAQHFAESSPAVDSAIASFSASRAESSQTPAPEKKGISPALLVISGLIALAVAGGAAYLLLRARGRQA